ncbi:hypothetical protein CCH79_00010521 [Gambusia affinis]|uniref:Phenazine biosynthesis-like domain-containing protein n=1 Tax=Gambusia affinis TaxID=33528 RepID=A0A315V270_GAMAF|nr:hypothetical protein CCH79_00010521 [Gambusia affinis]
MVSDAFLAKAKIGACHRPSPTPTPPPPPLPVVLVLLMFALSPAPDFSSCSLRIPNTWPFSLLLSASDRTRSCSAAAADAMFKGILSKLAELRDSNNTEFTYMMIAKTCCYGAANRFAQKVSFPYISEVYRFVYSQLTKQTVGVSPVQRLRPVKRRRQEAHEAHKRQRAALRHYLQAAAELLPPAAGETKADVVSRENRRTIFSVNDQVIPCQFVNEKTHSDSAFKVKHQQKFNWKNSVNCSHLLRVRHTPSDLRPQFNPRDLHLPREVAFVLLGELSPHQPLPRFTELIAQVFPQQLHFFLRFPHRGAYLFPRQVSLHAVSVVPARLVVQVRVIAHELRQLLFGCVHRDVLSLGRDDLQLHRQTEVFTFDLTMLSPHCKMQTNSRVDQKTVGDISTSLVARRFGSLRLLLSCCSNRRPHGLKRRRRNIRILSTEVFIISCIIKSSYRNSQRHIRMLCLSLDMAATASSWERNSTSASPVGFPFGAMSMWILSGPTLRPGPYRLPLGAAMTEKKLATSSREQFQGSPLIRTTYPSFTVEAIIAGQRQDRNSGQTNEPKWSASQNILQRFYYQETRSGLAVMDIPVFTLDAFTNLPFKGNPAAVCPLLHELSDDLYQKIAAEMNLSETAFITLINPTDTFTSGRRFRLRWFTPTMEINLCGHATLASAAVLFQYKNNVNPTLVFETRSGDLGVSKRKEGYIMDFPLNPPTKEDHSDFKDIIKVSNKHPHRSSLNTSQADFMCVLNSVFISLLQAAVGNHPVQEVLLSRDTKKLMIRLSDSCERSALTSLKVDPVALQSSDCSGRVRGVIVTMKGSPDCKPGFDFCSRYFAPWAGIPEDPVTGSAHTVLGSYWSDVLGKKKMLAYQCSSRGGELELEVRDDGRISIAGDVTPVLQGFIRLVSMSPDEHPAISYFPESALVQRSMLGNAL